MKYGILFLIVSLLSSLSHARIVGPRPSADDVWCVGPGGSSPAEDCIDASGNFIPTTTNNQDLGSSALKWKDLRLGGNAYIPTIQGNVSVVNGDITISTTSGNHGIRFQDGTTQISAAGSGTIGGNGTPNSIAKFSATQSIADSVLREFNSMIGINTAIPQNDLEINNPASGASLRLTGAAANTSYILFGEGGIGTNAGIYGRGSASSPASSLQFTTADSIRATIDSSGSFGIGLTNPSDKLTVKGAAIIGSASNDGLRIVDDGIDSYLEPGYTRATGQLRIRNSIGNNILNISQAGNVGIGSTAPLTALHIFGSDAAISLQGNGSSSPKRWGMLSSSNAGLIGTAGLLSLYNFSDSINAMSILPTGFVGIGSTNAVHILSVDQPTTYGQMRVSGNNTFGGVLQFADSGASAGTGNANSYIIGYGSAFSGLANEDKALVFNTNGNEVMRLTGQPRVGIRTTVPGALVHISSGELRLAGSGAQIRFNDGTVLASSATTIITEISSYTSNGMTSLFSNTSYGVCLTTVNITSTGKSVAIWVNAYLGNGSGTGQFSGTVYEDGAFLPGQSNSTSFFRSYYYTGEGQYDPMVGYVVIRPPSVGAHAYCLALKVSGGSAVWETAQTPQFGVHEIH